MKDRPQFRAFGENFGIKMSFAELLEKKLSLEMTMRLQSPVKQL